jgi:hypothetical protein
MIVVVSCHGDPKWRMHVSAPAVRRDGTSRPDVESLMVLQAQQLGDTLGRILAEDVTASEPLPPYPASIKVG